ncbi:peptidoglycan-binding domain-containing protein [Roseovarius litoreus]|nr:peptidoglycan-binding domain-containing protein [Roseovarius litoreus]
MAKPVLAGPEEALFETANIIYQSAEGLPPEMQKTTYESVRSILNQIVADYPASDLALQIILKEEIEGLDVANLNAVLQDAEESETAATEKMVVPAVPETTPLDPGNSNNEGDEVIEQDTLPTLTLEPEEPLLSMPVGSEATERELDLDRQAIRDLQARLLVIGHDPNGVDGAIGRGTRGAIRSWQSSMSAEPTGYLNTSQLAALKDQSQLALDEWLKDDANARAYKPPPPIALGPRNMSGNWRYTTNCGANSKLGRTRITGNMTMRHAGGLNYTGTLVNSQGLRARLNATLRGRNISGVANFGFLFGTVRTEARVDDQALILRGRDSNGCSFYARKS